MTDSKELDKMTDTPSTKGNDTLRWVVIVGLVVVAFFGAYRFASARTGQAAKATATQAGAVAVTGASTAGQPSAATPAAGSAVGADACCGGTPPENGVTGPVTTGAAVVEGGVQRISVDVTTVYAPNTITLKAGVPAEITFSQAQGCTQAVQSADLGFTEDLSAGPKTVTLKALQPGTYAFSCGMQMVFGKIVVE